MDTDDDIRLEVAELLWTTPIPLESDQISVAVSDAVVTLWGTVETRVDAVTLATAIAELDGVFAVDNRLDWIVDTRIPEQRFPGYPQEGAEPAGSSVARREVR